MPNYELKYLYPKGRVEPIRLVLQYLQIPFKDTLIDRDSEWPLIKNTTPFKQLPVFIVDDKFLLAETNVILRYLAKKHSYFLQISYRILDLEAENIEDQALCDMYAEYISDFILNIRSWVMPILKNLKEERDEKLTTVLLPQISENFGPIFEKQLEKNKSDFLLTYVDFMLAEWTDKLVTFGNPDILNDFSKTLAHKNKIFSLPLIYEYVKNRCTTNF